MIEPAAHDRWLYTSPHDQFVWERTRQSSVRLAELSAEVGERVPTVEALMSDLFVAFYRADVRWGQEPPSPEVAFHRQILERVLASPSYHRLHPEITGNLEDSLTVLDAFTRTFAASLNPDLVEFLDAEAAYHVQKKTLAQEAEVLEELINQRARPRRRSAPGGERGPEDLSAGERRQRLAELAGEIEGLEHRHRTDYRLVRARAELRRHLDDADLAGQLGEVAEALNDFHRALAVWGDEAGAEEHLALDDRLSLFRRLIADPRLRQATELLGRSRFRAAAAHRSRMPAAPQQLAGVQYGDDLSRLVPSEAVFLAEPAAEIEFLRRYAEHELLTFRVEDNSEPQRGPLIVCLDESSSMAGERDLVAKAIALAVIGIARNDHRDAALVEFAAHGNLRTTHFAAGSSSLLAVTDALSHFFGGGTDFDAPLQAAVELARADTRYRDADILIVTDGEARLHPDTEAVLRRERDEGRVRLFAVCVGVDDRAFREVSTRSWAEVDLVGDREALIDGLVDAVHPLLPTSQPRRV